MATPKSTATFYPLALVWCGAGVPEVADGSQLWSTQKCTVEELRDRRAELIVLETSAFETIDGCRRVYQDLAPPVLLIVGPHELAEAIGWLRDKDDICLAGTRPSLIAHRIGRLADARGKLVDSLTGVFTRSRLVSVLYGCTESVCPQHPLSLILADVDHFKAFNDRYGHGAGDHVLKQCGGVLRRICDTEELAARCGGQEFAVMVRRDADYAFELADRIRQEIGTCPMQNESNVTVSLGVATASEPKGMQSLFRQADEALYAAKAQGRNVTVSYREVESASLQSGDDVEIAGLENRARVLSERVANFITRRSKRLLRSVRAEAETDGLTQFYTRRYFDRRLETEFDQVVRREGKLSVGLIDVDYFGRVNKEHGWPTGDKVLRDVANILRTHVRATDWIGRYGGEEFCVVMPHTALEQACEVLERVRVAVAEARLTSTSGSLVPVTVSIGAVTSATADESPAELIERASTQTLAAKNAGRNCLRRESKDLNDPLALRS